MKYCIPDELFNRITYPAGPRSTEDVGIDDICNEILYKLPNAEDVTVRREVWHTLCDFCRRTGALLKRKTSDANEVDVSVDDCEFLRIVGAEANGAPTADFEVIDDENGIKAVFPEGSENCKVVISVRPPFADAKADANGNWTPKVPRYMIDRYGECIAHGALARLYAMRGEGAMARMHAVAYNNDLNRLSFGLITSGMRKHLLIDVEDWLINSSGAANGNG